MGGKKLDLVPSDDPPRAQGGLCLHFLKSTRSPLHESIPFSGPLYEARIIFSIDFHERHKNYHSLPS
uniref:Uncharacterized protein n=2 Tax=Populus TaxID=3689 RepID=A0A2K1ZDL3_POPTR|nr:hypothetical protein [Populus tomentosa]